MRPVFEVQWEWVSLLAGEVSGEDVGVVESDDELDGAGAGSGEEVMEEADEKDDLMRSTFATIRYVTVRN